MKSFSRSHVFRNFSSYPSFQGMGRDYAAIYAAAIVLGAFPSSVLCM